MTFCFALYTFKELCLSFSAYFMASLTDEATHAPTSNYTSRDEFSSFTRANRNNNKKAIKIIHNFAHRFSSANKRISPPPRTGTAGVTLRRISGIVHIVLLARNWGTIKWLGSLEALFTAADCCLH